VRRETSVTFFVMQLVVIAAFRQAFAKYCCVAGAFEDGTKSTVSSPAMLVGVARTLPGVASVNDGFASIGTWTWVVVTTVPPTATEAAIETFSVAEILASLKEIGLLREGVRAEPAWSAGTEHVTV